MRTSIRIAIILLVAATHAAAAQQATPASSATSPSIGSRGTDSGYSANVADFVAGKRVYLRSTKTFIGTITDVDDDHAFPADRFPRARMKAVLIVRRDGPRDWVPVDRITRIYLVRSR